MAKKPARRAAPVKIKDTGGDHQIIKAKPVGKKAAAVVPYVKPDPDRDIVSHITSCFQAGDEYRRRFKGAWDTIEGQIRCAHPPEWDKKEDWQTKIFIPQQSKTSETAQAYLDKMLFGQKQFYTLRGVETRDRNQEGYLQDLYGVLMDKGGFFKENDFVLNEACSGPGTAFLKVTVDTEKRCLKFTWRSAYNIVFDPSCGADFYAKQWLIDEYERPLEEMVSDVEKGNSLYTKEKVQEIIDHAVNCGRERTDQALLVVRGFDGVDHQIDPKYKKVQILEYWGRVPQFEKKGDVETKSYKDKIVAVANGVVKIRDDENPYGFTPIFTCRVKPRKYEAYGLGFMSNTIDLQELMNSMINLGFDSLKLCSMDIAIVDATKIKDPSTVEYRPMAVWMAKGNVNEVAKFTRQNISALGEIMRGAGMLDQMHQEATGVLRQVQGAPELGGGSSETLGEYQAKLAMIDNRFLKIARFIERDYIEPLLKGIYKIIFNPAFFNQALLDRILGTIPTVAIDPMTKQPMMDAMGQPVIEQKSKLNFEELAQAGDMAYDFRSTGMTQFTKSLETLGKLKELLEAATTNPQIQILVKMDELFKRTLQAADIPDYEEIMKSKEEIAAIMQNITGPGAAAPAPQGAA